MQPIARRRWRRLLIVAALLPILWLAASLVFVVGATRRPRAWFAEPAPTVAWGTLKEYRLRTADGQELGAWLHRGEARAPCVILLHGYRGCRRNGLAAAEFFAGRGCGVLLVSLRAHGDSTGEFNDFGYSARHDVVAAVAFLERELPGRPVIVNGTSLGSAAAVFAAKELGERVAGYVLESPYHDLHQALRNRAALYLPPVLDSVAYAGVALVGPLVLPDVNDIAPARHIANVPPCVPVLVLCGAKDERAFPWEAEALCGCVAGHSRLVMFDEAGHECLIRADRRRYEAALGPWLGEVVARHTGSPGLAR